MHLDHVGLSVESLDDQLAWYRKAFGFPAALPFEVPPLGMRGAFLVIPGGLAIELLERPGSTPGLRAANPGEAALTRGYGHICLRVDDVDTLHAHLLSVGAGERLAPQDSPEPGVRFCFVADPEGNLIELHDRKGPVTP
ncbi:MAG: VOC family protein [Microbacteriaceae bacterium]